MKFLTTLLIITSLYSILFSQETKQDPLQRNYNLGSSAEIALFWNFNSQGSKVHHKVFDYFGTAGQYFIDSSSRGTYTDALGTYGNEQIDAVTGDFDGDGLDEIVAVWEGENQSLNIVLPHTEKGSLTWDSEEILTLDNVLTTESPTFNSTSFHIVSGFFDKDANAEFAIAFWNSENNIELKVFDINENTLQPVEKASIADEYMNPTLNNSGIYDIAAGDFDGDLMDELILVAYEEQAQNEWEMYSKVYDYIDDNGNTSLIAKIKKENFYSMNDFFDPYHRINNLSVAAGDFTNNTLDEFVVDFVLYRNGSETYNYLLPAKVTTGLDTIEVSLDNLERVFQTLGTSYISIGLLTADFNNDGKDEIVVDGDGRIRIYDIDEEFNLNSTASNNRGTYVNGNRRIAIADRDAKSTDST